MKARATNISTVKTNLQNEDKVVFNNNNIVLLLLACAITHQSHGQGTVLEPCPRHNVQLNESMDPLR